MLAADLHKPVLLQEVVEYLMPQPGGIYVDGNLGLGGHTAAILGAAGPSARVIGFDWDEEALSEARRRLAPFDGQVVFARRNFAELAQVLGELRISRVDGVLLDLGLSSLQLDASGRGFSFKGSQPLDMRMDDRRSQTAADLVNEASQEELADIFYYYGEERQARRIAEFIVQERLKGPIMTTDHLVTTIARAVPRRFQPRKIHVATQVFQALRIAVNGELDNLERILADAPDWLKPEGRFCVISFHSLEDRLVKRAFQQDRRLAVVTRKPVTAGPEECEKNARARSAKLRVATRKEAA